MRWIDATCDAAWTSPEEAEWPVMHCRSVGYYWKKNRIALMLMDSLFDDWRAKDGTIGGMSTIPLGMILAITKP